MSIVALKIISLSELYQNNSKYTEKYFQENPSEISDILWDLGVNIKDYYEVQFNEHRNAFGKIYTGSRWVGSERTDNLWVKSDYASREAKDKATGNKLLADIYRSKGLSDDRLNGVWQSERVVKSNDED